MGNKLLLLTENVEGDEDLGVEGDEDLMAISKILNGDEGEDIKKGLCLLFQYSDIRCWQLNSKTREYDPVTPESIEGWKFYTEDDRQFGRDNILPVREMVYGGNRYIITNNEWTTGRGKLQTNYP